MAITEISQEYMDYLHSAKWKAIRENILCRDEFTCQLCGNKTDLQVHHIRGEHRFHEENYPEDLLTLCGDCHEKITAYIKIARYLKSFYEEKRRKERLYGKG